MSGSNNNNDPIEILPASFWESHGFTSNDATGMEILQQKLISGSSSLTSSSSMYGFQGALRYHELALPYWEAFVKNVQLNEKKLCLSYIQLPPIVWQTITPKIDCIKSLNLTDNELGSSCEGFFSLARFLSSNKTLEELTFNENGSGNDLTDLQAAKALSLAMRNHPTLQKVNAVYMEIGGHYKRLGNPTPEIAKEFIDGCENCTELHLNRVGMDDACAPAYGEMVKRNKKLSLLCIFWEYFTSKGVEEITKGVYDTTSLNDIADPITNAPSTFRIQMMIPIKILLPR